MRNLLLITVLLLASGFSNAQSKIAHLNSQDVMAAMPSYISAVQKLEKFQNDAVSELQAMRTDYQAAVDKYIAERDGLSPVRQQIEEEKLGKKNQAIAGREQNIQREVETYSRELNLPIIDKVERAVKNVSDRGNYDYVFDVSTLMIHKGPDITKDVIAEVLILEKEGPIPPPQEVIRSTEEIRPEVTRP